MSSNPPRQTRTVLSPHLQIYRLPLTAVLSISHRITGVILAAGFVLGNLLLALAAIAPDHFAMAVGALSAPIARALIDLWILILNYHLIHGIRHLLWDAGYGFSKPHQIWLGIGELLATGILTLVLVVPIWPGCNGSPA